MSVNISKLSFRKGLKNNLFSRISKLSTDNLELNNEDVSKLAEEYNLGVSTIYGTNSFYDFLASEHKNKKAFICEGTACLCAGDQDGIKDKLEFKLGKGNVGHMMCLGRCYETNAFHYDGVNYSGSDIDKIDEIIEGEKITSNKIYAKSYASKSFLIDDEFSSAEDFKNLLTKILTDGKDNVLDDIIKSNLRGRGGAGFAAGLKWQFCKDQQSKKKYVVCNADEGDPGAFSDRYLLENQALKVIFGMLTCAYIIGSDEGVLYIRGEYPDSIINISNTIDKLKSNGLLGENILDSNFNFNLYISIGQGAYICGEETALLASIEGRRAEVDIRPPFPTVEGLFKMPTVVNNVETLAAVPNILKLGYAKFANIGNSKSTGTKLICLDSFFKNPGVYEIDMGVRLKDVIYNIGGGFKTDVKALQIGGPLGGIVPITKINDLNLDFESFSENGFMLGHASFVSIPENFKIIEYMKHLFDFTEKESCGKCFPCRLGSIRGLEMIEQAIKSENKISKELLEELLDTMEKTSLCGLGGGLPLPIKNIIEYFSTELKKYFQEVTIKEKL